MQNERLTPVIRLKDEKRFVIVSILEEDSQNDRNVKPKQVRVMCKAVVCRRRRKNSTGLMLSFVLYLKKNKIK